MKGRVMLTLAVLAVWPLITAAGGDGGCATGREPRVETVTVKVPVAVPCADRRNAAPVYVDDKAALLAKAGEGVDAVVALLLGGREQRMQREAENEAQIAACAGPSPPP
jgi:hypothetical protein